VSIRGLYEDFEVALGPKKAKLRLLTPEVLKKVFSERSRKLEKYPRQRIAVCHPRP